MTDRYTDIKQKLCACAETDSSIRAIIVIGSTVRQNPSADEFSDLDLMIVTDAPEVWCSGEYPKKLGSVRIAFTEPTLGGGTEYRCIYDADRDTDMLIFTPELFDRALKDGAAGQVLNRGWVLLCDRDGYVQTIPQYVQRRLNPPEMTAHVFRNTVSDFFFHNIWACKKLRRGELWSAKMCIDGYLKERLLVMIEQDSLCRGVKDVWHDGRFLDRWADEATLRALKDCFAHYDGTDCQKALLATHRLFARLAADVAEKKGFAYPHEAEQCAAAYLSAHTVP